MTPIPELFEECGSSTPVFIGGIVAAATIERYRCIRRLFLDRLAHLAGPRCNDARLEHRPGAEGREEEREREREREAVRTLSFHSSHSVPTIPLVLDTYTPSLSLLTPGPLLHTRP